MNALELTGKTESHLSEVSGTTHRLHKDVLPFFETFKNDAAKSGFELLVTSSFRGFETQLRIWNEKATGKKPLLDDQGNPLDFSSLSRKEILFSILRWSALPSASRHHWGTDFDCVAKNLMPKDYKVQLTPQEIGKGGVFETFHQFLNDYLPKSSFYRPYDKDRGGVSPEWWHLSHKETAHSFQKSLTLEVIEEAIESIEIVLKREIIENLDLIFEKYVQNVA